MPRIASFDVVLFGATGFTGGLTAGYLAANAPEGARWALAGRNMAKLEEVRSGLGRLGDVPLLQADATDSAGLAAIARETRVVISTVGPYLLHGEPLVRACAEAGTDYVDLCGEPEFVDRMYLLHHDTALRTGARLVHACGFDSVPHDLGVYFTVKRLDAAARVRIRGVVRTNGSYSGGTLHSAMTSVSRARQMRATFAARRRAEGRPAGRTVRAIAGRPGRDPDLGYWLLPLPTIDPHIVVRSAAALPAYGPDFGYSHFAGLKSLRYAVVSMVVVPGLVLAAQVPPARRALMSRRQPGEGPSEARRSKTWFTVDFVADADGARMRTRVSGGDPGYSEAAKMLAESALCLAFDHNPATAGQVTTVTAMGDALLERLMAAGICFAVC